MSFGWTDEEAMPLTFDHHSGKVVFWVKQAGNEDVSIMQGAAARIRRSHLEQGLDADDARCMKAQKEAERAGYAQFIERIDLPAEDSITAKDQIAIALGRLPAVQYAKLTDAILGAGDLKPDEGKA